MPFTNKVSHKGNKTDKDQTRALLENLKDKSKLPKVDKDALKKFKVFYLH